MNPYLKHSLFFGSIIAFLVIFAWPIGIGAIIVAGFAWSLMMFTEYRHQQDMKKLDQEITQLLKQIDQQLSSIADDYEFR